MKHLIQIYELSLWSPSFGLGASHTFTHRGHTKPWLASQQTLRKALEVWVVGVVVAFRLLMFLLWVHWDSGFLLDSRSHRHRLEVRLIVVLLLLFVFFLIAVLLIVVFLVFIIIVRILRLLWVLRDLFSKGYLFVLFGLLFSFKQLYFLLFGLVLLHGQKLFLFLKLFF